MDKFSTTLVALAFSAVFAGSVCAQTASPRDGQDRRDHDKDKSDANLAIDRDQCGDYAGEAKERCIREARAQRDNGPSSYGAASSYAAPTSHETPSYGDPSRNTRVTPMAPNSSIGVSVQGGASSTGATSGSSSGVSVQGSASGRRR